MSDERKDRYMNNAVLWYSPSWVPNILEITTVGPQRTDECGEGQTDKQVISQTRIIDRLPKLSCILLVRIINLSKLFLN